MAPTFFLHYFDYYHYCYYCAGVIRTRKARLPVPACLAQWQSAINTDCSRISLPGHRVSRTVASEASQPQLILCTFFDLLTICDRTGPPGLSTQNPHFDTLGTQLGNKRPNLRNEGNTHSHAMKYSKTEEKLGIAFPGFYVSVSEPLRGGYVQRVLDSSVAGFTRP